MDGGSIAASLFVLDGFQVWNNSSISPKDVAIFVCFPRELRKFKGALCQIFVRAQPYGGSELWLAKMELPQKTIAASIFWLENEGIGRVEMTGVRLGNSEKACVSKYRLRVVDLVVYVFDSLDYPLLTGIQPNDYGDT